MMLAPYYVLLVFFVHPILLYAYTFFATSRGREIDQELQISSITEFMYGIYDTGVRTEQVWYTYNVQITTRNQVQKN